MATARSGSPRSTERKSARWCGIVAAALIGLALVLDAPPCAGAGALSHHYIARRSADKLKNDANTPAELRQALKDPDCLHAFCNGAVSPDLGNITDTAHYNDTTTIPKKMTAAAQANLRKANALPDSDPSKPAKTKQAQKELAFSYGWLSHCAADLSVHPLVNGIAGDAFTHCNTGQKMTHAAQEIQLDHYVNETLRNEGEKINYTIPYSLVASCTGKSEASLRTNARKMRAQMMGEILAMGRVTVPMDTLKEKWDEILQSCLSNTIKFVQNPAEFEDWDLDCGGRMTTAEFEKLRDAAIKANGGKLPKDWGKKYLDWFNKTKGMAPDKLQAALEKLVKGEELPEDVPTPANVKNVKVTVKLTSVYQMKILVNGTELSYEKTEAAVSTKGNRALTFKAMVLGSRRDYCMTKSTEGTRHTEVLERSPYVFHYVVDSGSFHGETKWEVAKEKYEWRQPSKSPGRLTSSGAHPKVENDTLAWNVPIHTIEQHGAYKRTYRFHVSADIDWKMVRSAPTRAEREESDTGFAFWEVVVEPE